MANVYAEAGGHGFILFVYPTPADLAAEWTAVDTPSEIPLAPCESHSDGTAYANRNLVLLIRPPQQAGDEPVRATVIEVFLELTQ